MHCTLVIYPAERKRDAILIASIIGNARAMDVARCGEVDATRYTHIISLTPQPLPWAAEEFISEAEDAAQAGERLRYRFERADGKVMPPDLLKERMESFLREHNTCALATCRKGKPRSTPMEYHYLDGCLFLLSSGGLKFIGFSETEKAALSISEPYGRFKPLAGFQAEGVLDELLPEDPLFSKLLVLDQVDLAVYARSPVDTHILRFCIQQSELLLSAFRKEGYGVRQYLTW